MTLKSKAPTILGLPPPSFLLLLTRTPVRASSGQAHNTPAHQGLRLTNAQKGTGRKDTHSQSAHLCILCLYQGGHLLGYSEQQGKRPLPASTQAPGQVISDDFLAADLLPPCLQP